MIYVLKRRGPHLEDQPNVVVVQAKSEAHARVAASDFQRDLVWTDPLRSQCGTVTDRDVLVAVGR